MSIKLRGVVFNDSPAFALLSPWGRRFDKTWPNLPTLDASVTLMRGVIDRLEILFSEGKASPTDVDICGNTLLHVSH